MIHNVYILFNIQVWPYTCSAPGDRAQDLEDCLFYENTWKKASSTIALY